MYNSGLVLEGGGTRAIYTSGVLDAFIEEGIEFPYVIGVSAGSCNGVSFIGKCYRRQHDITMNYCNDKRYMSLQSMIKNGEYLNTEWVFGELSYDLMPLDYEAYENSGTVMCAVVTNAYTGKAEYMYPKGAFRDGCPELEASCCLPGATKGVMIGDQLYFDGGLVDSIPLERALDDGCQKCVVILTQHKGYKKEPMNKNVGRMFKKYPMIAKAVENRHNAYNDQLKYVYDMQEKGLAYVIQPNAPLGAGTLEKDLSKLEAIYQLGYKQGKRHAQAVKDYLK